MDPCQLTMYLGALASTIAKNLSDDDLELLAVVLAQLGDTLATIAVRRGQCRSRFEERANAEQHCAVRKAEPAGSVSKILE